MKKDEIFGYISLGCFSFMLVVLLFICVYAVGFCQGKEHGNEIFHPIEKGRPPINTPVWAVYEQDGRLLAVAAIQYEQSLMEFNVKNGPIVYEPLEKPDAWLPLSAEWSTFN